LELLESLFRVRSSSTAAVAPTSVIAFSPKLEVLPAAQRTLWSELSAIPSNFILYGGTALALRLGHRTSVDFDFFSPDPLKRAALNTIPFVGTGQVLQDEKDALTLSVDRNGPVKVSFFGPVGFGRVGDPDNAGGSVRVASLLDLAGTKLKVLLQRVEAKDYLDIAALLRAGLPLSEMLCASRALFGDAFNPLVAKKTLAWFKGGDLSAVDKILWSAALVAARNELIVANESAPVVLDLGPVISFRPARQPPRWLAAHPLTADLSASLEAEDLVEAAERHSRARIFAFGQGLDSDPDESERVILSEFARLETRRPEGRDLLVCLRRATQVSARQELFAARATWIAGRGLSRTLDAGVLFLQAAVDTGFDIAQLAMSSLKTVQESLETERRVFDAVLSRFDRWWRGE
jgi:hypothetical protein